MPDVHVIDENRSKLNQFAQKCLERGVSLEEIKKTLLNIGWGENVVEMVLDNFR